MTSDRTFFLKTRAARATVRRAPRGRLAPSPTGALHLGNARTFLLAWLSIRSRNGTLVLRMEDLDHPKVKPAAAQEALDDLRWLGLDWDEGPDVGGPYEPYVQSARIAGYRAALERLRALGRVYPCVCSRRDVENAQSAPQEGEDGLFYAGRCRGRFTDFATAAAALPAGRLPAWRFRAEPGPQSLQDGFCGRQTRDSAVETGDFVLARHADGAGYMLACVVDDDAMRIDEALRGADLLAAAHRQRQVAAALGLRSPATTHVPLVVAEDGRRLAKRHGDTRLAALRERGVASATVVGLLAWWCGWAAWGETLRPSDLLARYDLATLRPSPAVLDARVRALLRLE
jgi:glutamyl-tRNA synthetase